MKKGKGKFIEWLGAAVQKVPSLVGAASMAMTGNLAGAFNEVKKVISNKDLPGVSDLSEDFKRYEMDFQKEVFAIAVEDRKNARNLFTSDSDIQKVFALIFMVGYIGLSYFLIKILMYQSEIPKLAETMIAMIWTGTSTKLGTIIDFFFGGSAK